MCGEILQAMTELAGYKSHITFKPLSRLINDTENNDLGNPTFYLQQNDFASIVPIAIYQTVFYYYQPNHQSKIVLQNLDDLKQYKIGILKGTLIDRLAFEQQGIEFETSYNQESIFKKLKLGRIDLALEIKLVAQQTINSLYPELADNFAVIQLANSTSPIAIMISEDQPDANKIGEKLQKALETLIAEGRYQAIIKKYNGQADLPESWFNELNKFNTFYNFITSE